MNKKDRKLIAKAYELNERLWNYALDDRTDGLRSISTHLQKVINRLEDELRKQVPE